MQDVNYLLKEPELEDSRNFQLLKEVGIKRIEELAYQLWTDYNLHDPGITLLELLCYGITDLGHRTAFDIKDLLTERINAVAQNNSNFHTAFHIFPSNPVTFNDLRKYLVDIDGVRHAWINKHRSITYCLDPLSKTLKDECVLQDDELCAPLNGLYDVLLQYEDFVVNQRVVHLGAIEVDIAAAAAPDEFRLPDEEGMEFYVKYDCILEAIHVYAQGAEIGAENNLTLRLLRKEEDGDFQEVVFQTGAIQATIDEANPEVKTRVALGIELEAGYTYRLDANGTMIELFKQTGNYNYGIHSIIQLLSGFNGTTTDEDYFYFYDWELTYAVLPEVSPGDHPQLETNLGLSDNTLPLIGSYMNSNGQGIIFNVYCPLILQGLTVYPENDGSLTLRLYDRQDNLLVSHVEEILPATTELQIELNWEIPPGTGYSIRASGTGMRLYRTTNNPGFPFHLPLVAELIAGRTLAGNPTQSNYYFLYDWQIAYTPAQIQTSELTQADIRLAVRERLHSVRNLCEDFVNISDLGTEQIGLCADIEVRPDVDVEETLAEILFQMEAYVSPPVNFYTIDELLEKGKTTDEIFAGPILDHGFIDDDEFRAIARRCFLRTSDIIQMIMDVKGVLAVKEITLLSLIAISQGEVQPGDEVIVEDGQLYRVKQEPWILHLHDVNRYAPDFSPHRSRVIFYKRGLPYYANLERVMELYKEKRARNINGKLKGHEQDIPIPIGAYKALEEYTPLQNDLPATYRVGPYKVRESETDLRKAQSRQLRGFILFFEQYFTNYLAQLSRVRELFSWEETAEIRTYFTQTIDGLYDEPDLYNDFENLEIDLNKIIEDQDTAEERKNRFLDHLLGRFAEDFSEYTALMYHLSPETGPAQVIQDKQMFLANYPKLSSQRGKSFDYRYPFDPDNLSGYQCRLYHLLGIDEVIRRNFASPSLSIVQVGPADPMGCEEDSWRFVLKDVEGTTDLFVSTCCSARSQICALQDEVIVIGAAFELDLKGDLEDQLAGGTFRYEKNVGTGWNLVTRCPAEAPEDPDVVSVLGHVPFDDEAILAEVIAHFRYYAKAEGFHVVEHILLRKRTTDDPFMPVEIHSTDEDCECVEVKDPYSFRASIILPSWPERFQNIRFRQYVEDLLRLEAPAHVLLKICWINHCEMQTFEACHDEWLLRHANLDENYRGAFELINDTPPPRLPAIAELPNIDQQEMEDYRDALHQLIDKLHRLTNVFPTARLHDCGEVSGDAPQITLNNTSLGTL